MQLTIMVQDLKEVTSNRNPITASEIEISKKRPRGAMVEVSEFLWVDLSYKSGHFTLPQNIAMLAYR